MPFVITCPDCGKTVRSAREREIGKGVQCAKCGAQFYVSAGNQEEVRDEPPRRDPAEDRPARRRPPDRDDEEPRPRRQPDGDDPPPRRKSGGRKKVLLLLAVAALGLFLLCGGVGAYFLFFQGASAAHKVRPPRDLRDDMFAYVPTPAYKVEYEDYDYARQTGGRPSQSALDFVLPKGAGVPVEQVAARCSSSAALVTGIEITLLAFAGPQDLAAVAARCKFPPLPGDAKGVYAGKDGLIEWAAFQPAPTKIVFVKFPIGGPVDPKKLAAVMARDPQAANLSPVMREGLAVVSGYPKLMGFEQASSSGPEAKGEFSGTLTTADRVQEMYSFQWFRGEAQAKAWFNMPRPKFKEPQKPPEGELEKSDWLRGDRIYHYRRVQLKD